MPSEEKFTKVEVHTGDFGECLVAGSAEEQSRRRKVKRRAIAISVALESLLVCALVIAPMLAKPAVIKVGGVMPIPPYRHATSKRHSDEQPHPPTGKQRCFACPGLPVAPLRPTDTQPHAEIGPAVPIGDAEPENLAGIVNALDRHVQPPPPDVTPDKKRLVVGHIDPALLTRRVEPVFPPLARQIRRNGKVELHAIIAADGSIQSLEVVSGDPMFIPSALDAVRQWHYRPTMLNGNPVEIDTFITVIYSVNQQ